MASLESYVLGGGMLGEVVWLAMRRWSLIYNQTDPTWGTYHNNGD